jgi:thiol-disulfide isomerase/thioredoxin
MNYLIIENNNPENISKIQQLNQHIRNKKPAVIYFYKDGCPFCERTTPEWDNLPNHLSKENDLLVARINKLLFDKFNSIGEKPALYPNIRYINGSNIDTFKKEGDERNTKNLAMWIQQHHKSTQPKISVSIQQPVQPIIQKPIIQEPNVSIDELIDRRISSPGSNEIFLPLTIDKIDKDKIIDIK